MARWFKDGPVGPDPGRFLQHPKPSLRQSRASATVIPSTYDGHHCDNGTDDWRHARNPTVDGVGNPPVASESKETIDLPRTMDVLRLTHLNDFCRL
ncbi:hypothetical protein AXF42_Ash005544 [Apostasia shenzhenica]|uniref:Uncharacterized protein n=1 Tax=Apostasia shenzhenica TaxID=1088818 RepID=A0A2I0B785_9ASPA|nr:hypothetical protein AXF42_Ash005544 [Apostasia shenzhenica]